MPLYDYRCERCGVFECTRSVATRDSAPPCPECGEATQRVTVTMPRLARSTDQDSQETPPEGRYGMRHAAACSCC
ncbi:FmdB family zinc ribbon protein [Paraburkholderia tropica]|uniref:FmdB family zinc ribbon protein n=1 Tax=Paraburkholderia tropica TaxID=92647 RepID=UPI00158FE056|nr:FmdB family zinc ribbon protein [Paraburkholderia tropica]